MSGWANGVQAKIKEVSPKAMYVHCHSHRLNLVLVDSMRYIPELSDLFDIVQALYVFFSNSSARHEIFMKAQEELGLPVMELERTVTTRWFYFYRSIIKIRMRYEALLISLVAVSKMKNKDNSINIAKGLLERLKSPATILSMFVAENILKLTNSLSEQLQRVQLTIGSAFLLILSMYDSLKSQRGRVPPKFF